MNDNELENIWCYLEPYMLKEKTDSKNKCCKDKENIVIFSDSATCKVCGLVQHGIINNDGYSEQHSIMIPGMSSGISGGTNLSKKLNLTNYKCSTNKIFQAQKNDWIMKTKINEQVQSCHAGIPENVVGDAIGLFRMFEAPPNAGCKKMIVRRNVRTSVIAGCLYLACKKHNIFRSPMEIGEILCIKKSLVIKGCKILRERLCIKQEEGVSAISYIPRICSDLSLSFKIQKEANELYIKYSKLESIKKFDPRILSGAILHMTCVKNNKDDGIKKDIALVTGVSEVSITRTLNSLIEI